MLAKRLHSVHHWLRCFCRFYQGRACPHALPSGNHEVAEANEDKQLAFDPPHTWLSYIQETYSRLVMPPGNLTPADISGKHGRQ